MSGANLKFYQDFQSTTATLEADIDRLASTPSRQADIDDIRGRISRLSNTLADATDYLPTYDQKTYAETIKGLTDTLNKKVDKVAPKPRFQFKPRSKPSAPGAKDERRLLSKPATDDSQSATPSSSSPSTPAQAQKDYNVSLKSSPDLVKKPSFSSSKTVNLTSHENLHIVLPPSASHATSYGDLSDFDTCVVDMSGPARGETPFAGLSLRNMRRCIVVTGDVEGAVHITGVRDAVVVVVSRQVRIHECERVDFYLHCSSHPIIEDCSEVRFAPNPECYTPPWSSTHENQWDQVDDFKWLKADHSPNWSVLPEEDRLADDFWADVVPGKTSAGVTDILTKAGIIS
ncbi:related to tubulin folding cofactor C [Cephalotrichum gorgonifer]|uniref:Related to tubulin folding cofactor C n=1 Tax=Cephalotrichum gorgonifer TaxID=2041049 RepID=A0AAE8N2U7_9PEZI|nr:related to tubulin folding cofactor C [Cephalotrichum gorgonifer]